MLLRRTGRLSAAALEQAFRSPGWFRVRVTAGAQGDWTLALRRGHALQRHRFFCVSVGGGLCSPPAHLGKRPQLRDQSWDSAQWGQLVAESLSRTVRTEGGGHLRLATQPLVGVKKRHVSRGQPAGGAVFTPNWGVGVPDCSSRTTQIRTSSTAPAANKSEGRKSEGSKVEEENLKEASAAPEKAPMEPEPEGGKPNKTQQLKKVFKEYGAVGVSFHIGISLMSLGMFYLLLSSGIDMAALLCKVGFSEAVVQSKMAAGTSTFVLAYAIHKLFAPVRISITLVSVPLIVRYLRKTGLFKPPTPAP